MGPITTVPLKAVSKEIATESTHRPPTFFSIFCKCCCLPTSTDGIHPSSTAPAASLTIKISPSTLDDKYPVVSRTPTIEDVLATPISPTTPASEKPTIGSPLETTPSGEENNLAGIPMIPMIDLLPTCLRDALGSSFSPAERRGSFFPI